MPAKGRRSLAIRSVYGDRGVMGAQAVEDMVTLSQDLGGSLLSRFHAWASRVGLGTKLAIALAVAAVISVIATYVALTDATFSASRKTILSLLLVNLVLLLALGAVIARRLVRLWAARRSGLAGSGLHSKLVALFSIIAIAPTIVVAIFSALFFELGVQSWFNDQVRTVLDKSLTVAEAYTEEHRKVIRADILAMASDLNRQAPLLAHSPARLEQVVTGQAALRSLSEAIMFDSTGRVLARANLTFSLGLDRLPTSVLRQAASGEIVVLTNNNDDRVRALIRLDGYFDTYLYVSRFIDPQVLGYVEKARATVQNYDELEANLGQVQTIFNLIYVVLALLVLLAAVWTGLWLASRLVAPISNLVTAAERVRGGDLTARVPETLDDDELGMLSRSFNRMTGQLYEQRTELMEANEKLDARRRFTEAVLSGVTAGVVGLDQDGCINMANRSAAKLLGQAPKELNGRRLAEVVPEMAELVADAQDRPRRIAQGQVNLERGGKTKNLLVRVSAETFAKDIGGLVVTFDDITDLVAAQRTAAWADIARRIAHEIKNPLTPIQLSAERLRRKYSGEVSTDPAVFEQCTDTIVRHVGDIRRMVDEFSAFARMPAPVFRPTDLCDLIRQAVFVEEISASDVTFRTELPSDTVTIRCDGRQIAQALANLLKNAVDSIATRRQALYSGEEAGNAAESFAGLVELRLIEDGEHTVIEVADNGCGLPGDLKHRLTEPYVTTRVKGTGLGLAIVKKVIQDHGGELELNDRAGGGAVARLVFHLTALKSVIGGGESGDGADGDSADQKRREASVSHGL